jgi:hypothetical protein
MSVRFSVRVHLSKSKLPDTQTLYFSAYFYNPPYMYPVADDDVYSCCECGRWAAERATLSTTRHWLRITISALKTGFGTKTATQASSCRAVREEMPVAARRASLAAQQLEVSLPRWPRVPPGFNHIRGFHRRSDSDRGPTTHTQTQEE